MLLLCTQTYQDPQAFLLLFLCHRFEPEIFTYRSVDDKLTSRYCGHFRVENSDRSSLDADRDTQKGKREGYHLGNDWGHAEKAYFVKLT